MTIAVKFVEQINGLHAGSPFFSVKSVVNLIVPKLTVVTNVHLEALIVC